MALLTAAHADVGGEVVSGGGTGTYAVNQACTEIQAGSYALMDTSYGATDVPFEQALRLLTTVVSVHRQGGWAVLDGGLKALGMDHGNPTVDGGGEVWFCSDEHTTYSPADGSPLPKVGDRVHDGARPRRSHGRVPRALPRGLRATRSSTSGPSTCEVGDRGDP